MTTAERVLFNEVIYKIRATGANVVSKFYATTPVVTVDRPVSGLVDKAVQVHEYVNGLHRTIHVARMYGVCVKWSEI